MSKIIMRHGRDDFDAFRIAQGMENAGAQVFSISPNGTHQLEGALIPCTKFIVWAKFEDPVTPDQIDAMIEKEFGN